MVWFALWKIILTLCLTVWLARIQRRQTQGTGAAAGLFRDDLNRRRYSVSFLSCKISGAQLSTHIVSNLRLHYPLDLCLIANTSLHCFYPSPPLLMLSPACVLRCVALMRTL